MSKLCDSEIIELCATRRMIEPFEHTLVRDIISYGPSSYGYDIRLFTEFAVYKPGLWKRFLGALSGSLPHLFRHSELDLGLKPTEPKESDWFRFSTKSPFWLFPGEHILGVSLEKFTMPRQVIGIVAGKSTLCRNGLIANISPLESGWRGFLTIELHNATRAPVEINPLAGTAQITFDSGIPPLVSYEDRAGEYQDQPQIPVIGKVKKNV